MLPQSTEQLSDSRREYAKIIAKAWAIHCGLALVIVLLADYVVSYDGAFWYDVPETAGLTVFATTIISIPTTQYVIRLATVTIEKAEKEASTDFLTKLPNRRALQQYAEERFASENHYGAFLLLDIDHFKSINDTYGHDTGDEILKDVAKVLRTAVRENTLVYRWGGEEFALMLPFSDEIRVRQLAERLRKAVEEHPFTVERASRRIGITVSLGLVTFDHPDATLKELYREADSALYRAKAQGRNRVLAA